MDDQSLIVFLSVWENATENKAGVNWLIISVAMNNHTKRQSRQQQMTTFVTSFQNLEKNKEWYLPADDSHKEW